MTHRALAGLLVLALVRPAVADDGAPPADEGTGAATSIPGHTIDRGMNGGLTGVFTGIGLISQLVPLRAKAPWAHELSSSDEALRGTFSPLAGHLADAMLGMAIGAPAIYLLGSTIDDADGDKLILYGQSLAVNAMLAGVVKRLVQRPRPYTYSRDPLVRKYIDDEGDDAYLSFYSGHSALAFGASVTGAYLLGASNEVTRAEMAWVWAGGMMTAAAAANLRVRAGKHYYSDVIVGSLVGIAVGYAVPALHADGKPYLPSGTELVAGAGGMIAGVLVSSLIPIKYEHPDPGAAERHVLRDIHLTPTAMAGGGFGFAIGGGM